MTNIKFRVGDRVVVVDHIKPQQIGIVGTIVSFTPSHICPYNVKLDVSYCDLSWLGYKFEELALESVYNSKLYKLLNEEDHAQST